MRPGDYSSLYNANVYQAADLFELYLLGSRVLRITNADANVTDAPILVGGTGTYYAANATSGLPSGVSAAPIAARSSSRAAAGLEIATLEVSLSGTATIDGQPLAAAAVAGVFDRQIAIVRRVYFTVGAFPAATNNPTPILISGVVTGVEPSSTEVRLTVSAKTAALSKKIPGRLVQGNCPYPLYGTLCAVSDTTHKDTSKTVSSATTTTVTLSSSSTYSGVGGTVGFGGTDPRVNGQRRVITNVAGAVLTFYPPLSATPANGIGLTIWRGCDKKVATCNGTFANLLLFGGFPNYDTSFNR